MSKERKIKEREKRKIKERERERERVRQQSRRYIVRGIEEEKRKKNTEK